MKRIGLVCLVVLLLSVFAGATRQMERLDRGLVAVKVSGGVFLSWRLFGTDPSGTAFNLYRDGTKINSAPISTATNYTDASGTASSKYAVRPVIGGTEKAADKTVSVWSSQMLTIALDRPAGGTNASGSYTYSPNDIAVGDLDGDGEYELVLKWDPSNSKDNSQKGYTGNVYVDAYKLNGTKLWRLDLGVNIRAGAHYTQMLVGDYDLDGYAEVAMKTAPGTKDGTGAYLASGPAASDNDASDFRNSSGYVLSGAEYLTIFNGKTGKEMATVNYNPARGTVSSWGDSYGNRVDRFLATNAYLDGTKPSMIFQRGYYTRMAVTAYDWDGKTLSQRWYYNAATKGSECYGQGNHNVSAGDVDGDGKDEIIEGDCAIDHDGKFMYRTGKGHGDAMHLGDLSQANPGLEVWEVHEDSPYGYDLHDAATGKILWSATSSGDNGRGVAADVDSTSAGYEMWSGANWNTYSSTGTVLASSRPAYNFRVYWDGDLLDELLDNVTISKWNSSTAKSTTLLSMTGSSCNSTKATPNLSGDILGDWREEVILHDDSHLYLYTTTIPTSHRMYTLMHDPVYRLGMSWQNTAYNQPPHLGFWLGAGDSKIPTPDIALTGEDPIPTLAKTGAGSSAQTILLGDSIQSFSYAFANCTGASAMGLPAGVTAETSGSAVLISGTPAKVGTFTFTITTSGGNGDAATMTGTITVVGVAGVTAAPAKILSSVNAAVPFDGFGAYEEKNAGWIDSGYYNFTNSADSYGYWKLVSENAGNAILVVRFANGGTAARHMNFAWNEEPKGGLPFKMTSTWTTYDSVCVSVPLVKGLNTIKLSSMSADGGPNVDEFEFDVAGVSLWTEADSNLVDDQDTGATAVRNGIVKSDVSHNFIALSGAGFAYSVPQPGATLMVFDLRGALAMQADLPAAQGYFESAEWNALKRGGYIVGVRSQGRFIAQALVNKMK
jgi:rhamnogalacturonan endolyase